MKDLWIRFLAFFGMAHWVELTTEIPCCTYYFGPFANADEAERSARLGYVEDIQEEGAHNIQIQIKQCKPSNLTIFDEDEFLPLTPNPLISVAS